jgi:signal transduction histidine kinase
MSALAGGTAAIDAFAKSLGDFALLCREGSPASSEWRVLVCEAGAGLVARAAALTTRLELALSQPIRAIHDHVLARIASHSVSLGQGTPPDAAGLPADARAIVVWSDLDTVTDHLVRNAREASGEAVTMRVAWVRSATRIRLMLSDDGPGIPEGIRDHVFHDAFSTRGHDRGTGLPEARRAAEAFLSILSLVEPGAGSVGATFAIDFWTSPFPDRYVRSTGQEDSTH